MEIPEKYYPFIAKNIDNLSAELTKPFTKISMNSKEERWNSPLTLWQSHKVGIRINNQMFDLEDRLEVGVLAFSATDSVLDGHEIYDLPESFHRGSQVQKLIINEGKHRLESGMKIVSPSEEVLLIVPNAMPYSLAICCPSLGVKYFEPEYDREYYEIEDM